MANLSQAQKDFVARAYEWAEEAGLSGRVADLAVAQAAHETGYGRSLAGKHNYHGIKGRGTRSRTHEIVNGRRENITASFRDFESPVDSFRQWHGLMSRVYPDVLKAGTLHEAVGGLNINRRGRPNYATDPKYETRMFEYMDRFDDLGCDVGLNDIVAPFPTERGVSQQADIVARQMLDPHSGNMGLVERQSPAWSDQFAPGPAAAPKSTIQEQPIRSDYPTGPLNPEPWQDLYAPAPQYAPRTPSQSRFDQTFAPSDPQVPPLTPGTSDTGKAVAFRGLADTMQLAGVGGLDGRAATCREQGGLTAPSIDPAPGLVPDIDTVPYPTARPPMSSTPEFAPPIPSYRSPAPVPPVPKPRPRSGASKPALRSALPRHTDVPIPTPRPATSSGLPMMPSHANPLQQHPSPYTGLKKQIFDFVLRRLMSPDKGPN